jgi:transcriptional regulator with XRE-family HTH domain
MFDYSKLKGRMAETRTTQEKLASKLGISNNSFSRKMNGISDFSSKEIAKICNYLNISNTQVGVYFFTPKV